MPTAFVWIICHLKGILLESKRTPTYPWNIPLASTNLPNEKKSLHKLLLEGLVYVPGVSWKRILSHEKKPTYFPLNPGGLIGILISCFIIIPIKLGSFSSPIKPKQPVYFFIAQADSADLGGSAKPGCLPEDRSWRLVSWLHDLCGVWKRYRACNVCIHTVDGSEIRRFAVVHPIK